MNRWLALGLSLVLIGNAEATRLTPSTRATLCGGASGGTVGAQTQSVSIPVGATSAVIAITGYNSVGGDTQTSVSLDGQAATLIVSATDNSAGMVNLYKVSGFSTGAGKTLAYTNGVPWSTVNCAIEYRDGTPTYGASGSGFSGSSPGTASTGSLANSSGDEILSAYATANSSSTSVGSGQTKLDETNDGVSEFYGFTTEVGTGSGDVQSVTADTPGIASVIISTASGAFDTSPTISAVSTTAYTVIGSLTGAGTVKSVACYTGTTLATIAEINAAHCTGGSTPAASASNTPGGAPWDFSLNLAPSQSPPYPIYDICTTDGTTRVCQTNQFLSPPSTCGGSSNQQCQFVQLASVAIGGVTSIATLAYDAQTQNFLVGDTVVGGTSGARCQIRSDTDAGSTGTLNCWIESGVFQDNEALTGLIYGAATVNGTATYLYAANDVVVAPTYVMPGVSGSTIALTIDTDGTASYSSGLERETALNINIYDYDAIGYASGDIDFISNDSVPNCVGATLNVQLAVNVAMTPIDLDSFCSDADLDSLTSVALQSQPPGLSLDGSTNIISGTPTVENLAGVSVQYVVSDLYGALGSKTIVFFPHSSWNITDCTSSPTTVSACTSAISILTLNTVSTFNTSVQCSATVADGYVASQNPTAGSTISPGDTVSLVESSGPCSIPSCLGGTVTQCTALVTSVYATASVTSGSGCTGGSSRIYSQAPAVGAAANDPNFVMTVYCR